MSINIVSNASNNSLRFVDYDAALAAFKAYLQRVNRAVEKALSITDIQYKEVFNERGKHTFYFLDELDPFFAATGLTIYQHGSAELLPEDGIRSTDYLIIKAYMRMMGGGLVDAKIKIHRRAIPEFRQLVLFDLIILLSRTTSRALILNLLKSKESLQICQATGDQVCRWRPKSRRLWLKMDEMVSIMTKTEDGKGFLFPAPRFEIMGHEFVHALQSERYPLSIIKCLSKTPPVTHVRYVNQWEEMAISGDFFSADLPYAAICEKNIIREFGMLSRDDHFSFDYDFELPFTSALTDLATPLHAAAFLGGDLNIQHWLQSGGDIEELYRGFTLLHAAIHGSHEKSVELLLNNRAPLDQYNAAGHLPIHTAAKYSTLQIFQRLLEAGADPETTTLAGETALDLAIENGNEEIINCLKKKR